MIYLTPHFIVPEGYALVSVFAKFTAFLYLSALEYMTKHN